MSTTGTKANKFIAKSSSSRPVNGQKNIFKGGSTRPSSTQIASVSGTINSALKGPHSGGLG